MQHLTPVGLSQDGTQLVLVSDTGEEFSVPVDQRLRTALRGDNARLGQLEMKMESALRPRDIQARIRAGESAEAVAAAAQTTVEAIMPFASPVLAERAHVAQTAVKCSIRRASADSAPVGRTLDEASRTLFSTIGVRAEDVEWDAWRREDGRWTLVATYAAGGTPHRAELTFDQRGRYVVADDDEALLLTGEATPAGAPETPSRRLSAVPSDVDELPLGDDALELVREPRDEYRTEALPLGDQPIEDQPIEEQAAQAPVPEQADDLAADHADADWIVPEEPAVPEEEPAAELPPPPEDEVAEAPAPAKKKGRSSVPSWDEIMFGGGKHD